MALVASGPFFSAAVSAAGHLYVWGEHPTAGVGGARAGGDRPVPDGGGRGSETESADGGAEVRLGTDGPRVLAVRVCGFHALAATHDGAAGGLALWSWGEDAARQLCRSPPAGMDLDDVPARLPPLPSSEAPPSIFGCGGFHTLVASADGLFRCGEAGEPAEAEEADEAGWPDTARPPRVSTEHLPGFSTATDSIVQLEGGHVHSLALSASGRVWAWGSNTHGQLGRPTGGPSAAAMQAPHEVLLTDASGSAARITHVAAGGYHSVAVASDGTVFSWGANSHAQLARPSATVVDPLPARVPLPLAAEAPAEIGSASCTGGRSFDAQAGACVAGGARAVAASAGVHHSLVLLSDGRVCAFGDNSYGQQGRPAASRSGACQAAAAIPGGAVQLASGELHVVALSALGEVYTWGGNSNGQLGRTSSLVSAVPGRVPLRLREGERAVAVSAGGYHSAVVTSEGRLLMLGRAAAADEEEAEDDGGLDDDEEGGAGEAAPAGHSIEAPMEGTRGRRGGGSGPRGSSARPPAGGGEALPPRGDMYAAGEEPEDAYAFALEADVIDW